MKTPTLIELTYEVEPITQFVLYVNGNPVAGASNLLLIFQELEAVVSKQKGKPITLKIDLTAKV